MEEKVEPQEGEKVEPQEGERKKKVRRGRRSVTAQAIRWEKAVKRVNENALEMKRQIEQNELHSYETDERLSVSETQATEIEKRLSRMQATEFLKTEFKNEFELRQAEQQAQQTQQVLAKYQQQQQKRQMKGGKSGIGSFASKYQPPSVEEECPAAKEGFGKIFHDGELVNRV